MAVPRANTHPTHLPTPPSQISPQRSKSKRSLDTQSYEASPSPTKRQRIESEETEPHTAEVDPLSYWVETNTWPRLYTEPSEMPNPSKKRGAKSSNTSATHWSEKYRELAQHGVYDDEGPLLHTETRDFCRELLKPRFQTVRYASIPHHKFRDVLRRVKHLNESRLQRDITPCLIPSPEILRLWGEEVMTELGEEINMDWIRCQTMGSTRPKPDLTVGLMPSAFSQDETKTLQNYASPEFPCFFTPNLCFPFLTCEAKSSQVGLDVANGQNLHSAAISVRAIFRLYERAYGWRSSKMLEDLDGRTLVFSISHDPCRVALYSHFAICGDATSASELRYYRYTIQELNFEADDGSGHLVSYNFVRNVYDRFAPSHLSRIREAVAVLPRSRSQSPVPSEASEWAEDVTSQDQSDAGSSEGDSRHKHVRHSGAAVATMRTQMAQLMEQLTQQREELAQQQEGNTKQLAQQREDSAKQMSQLMEQSTQQREELALQREGNTKQLALQREESTRQLALQREESTRQLAQQREDSAKQMSQLMEQLTQQREDSAKQLAHLQQIIDVLCKKQA
ncbi:MAG: hypothetical protein Q9162_007925 [Coniocarpon cinnabarinum]